MAMVDKSILAGLMVLLLFGPMASPSEEVYDFLLPAVISSGEEHHEGKSLGALPHPRIGFWNMHWFPSREPEEVLSPEAADGYQAVIRQLDADLLFLAEVRDLESLRALRSDYPHLLCTAIRRPVAENADLPVQGLALLSRMRWVRHWVIDFSDYPDLPDRPARGILAVQFQLSQDRLLTCYALHLKSNLGSIPATAIQRERTIDYLIADWERTGVDPATDPVLILGDMNTSITDPLFSEDNSIRKLVKRGFRDAGAGRSRSERITYRSDGFAPNDFDWILVSPGFPRREALELGLHEPAFRMSDHAAIYVDTKTLRLKRPD